MFFKGRIADLNLTEPILAKGYKSMSFDAPDMPNALVKQWESLTGAKWNVPGKAHIFFITKRRKVVSTVFFIADDKISTGIFHTGICNPKHRKKGFYKYSILKGIPIMKARGIRFLEVYTNKSFLWPFWDSLGLKRVRKISYLAHAGRAL